jgi:1-phosphofructokinase family hexose kinase
VSQTLIVALNPSIDAEWRVADVQWEEKNNIQSERRWAGGKGINVARWLKHIGGKPRLLLPLGGKTGDELAGYLRAEGISTHVIPLNAPTRVNVNVTTEAGRQMRFNPLGPKVSGAEWRSIVRCVEANLHRTVLLVLSGSLPRAVPVTAYAQLIRIAHRFGVRTLLDCDGPAFAAGIEARPFLVKPNEHELAQWWTMPLRSEKELVQAARALSEKTRSWVLVSRGAKRSWLVNIFENAEISVAPPPVKVRNTVGAGDAMLAAVAAEIQASVPPKRWLAAGVSVGSRATQFVAGELPR